MAARLAFVRERPVTTALAVVVGGIALAAAREWYRDRRVQVDIDALTRRRLSQRPRPITPSAADIHVALPQSGR